MNIQLVVVNANGDDVWLDLYEEQPIKLTFNIEDILTATPKAEFTRQFRLPATDTNYNFFSTAFEIIGVDFNPGVKYTARIVVDGDDFRQGELRLQNIYRNDITGKIDYACVFIGSAKSLASELGEKHIGDLDWTDYTAPLTLSDITASWEAFPEGGLTDGLQDGNLLYPVVDFGNTYNGSTTQQTRIAVGHPSADGGSFDQSNHPLEYTRFKPMVRMREVMRRIFEQNGFTFTGQFLTTNQEVAKMYLSAWGNSQNPGIDLNPTNANLAKFGTDTALTMPNEDLEQVFVVYDNIYSDPENNVDDNITYGITGQTYTGYVTPIFGQYSTEHFFNISVNHVNNSSARWRWFIDHLNGTQDVYDIFLQTGTGACAGLGSEFQVYKNFVLIESRCSDEADGATDGEGFTEDQFFYDFSELNANISNAVPAGTILSPGEILCVYSTDSDNSLTINGGSYTEITAADGEFSIAPYWDTDYKCIDALKDIFTLFRLVMIPDPNNPTNFLIIPWKDYIGSGQLKNWSTKLVKNKDMVIRPILLDQSDRVTLTQAPDKDYYNTENENIFNEVFGTRKLDSTYDILEGEKTIQTKLAATPASQIEGYTANWDGILIPQIHLREAEDTYVKYTPTKPKTRLLYYDGTITLNGDSFWLEDESANPAIEYFDIPVVSTSDQMPNGGPNNRNLVFEKETHFDQSGNALLPQGQDLYGRYWSKYFELLYNKDSRRVTAYFVLDADDILNFRYSDVIYVEGVYYYVEKIYDAPLGKKAEVKVDLITLKDYRPSVNIAPQPTNIVWENASANWETGYTNNWENV